MSDTVGFQGRYHVKICIRCGEVFRTFYDHKTMCAVCSRRDILKDARRKRTRIDELNECKAKCSAGKSINEIIKLAAEKGMTYGEYVSKFGT